MFFFFFFQAEDGIRDGTVTGVQTCALPISDRGDERHDDSPRYEGAAVVDERVAQRHDLSFAREPQLDLVPLVTLLSHGEEMLAARLDEPYRTIERASKERYEDIFRIQDTLGTEPATDILCHDAHRMLG